jgi:hypothetical protein
MAKNKAKSLRLWPVGFKSIVLTIQKILYPHVKQAEDVYDELEIVLATQ